MDTNKNILIIDDVVENIDILARYLEKDGFNIFRALEAPQGLHILKSEDIDLVLLDINMPVVDGITLLESIKNDSALSHVNVVMVTANDDINTAMKCLKIGAAGYITKPFSMEHVNQQIKNCLN